MIKLFAGIFTIGTGLWIASPVYADAGGETGYGHHMWDGGGMFMGTGMMAIFLIAVIVIILLLEKGLGGDSPASSSNSSAMDVLSERYARGEIDTAEYEERKQRISGKS